ncbi:MAG: adenosine kinase [Pseudomonadota bacterium]
MSSTPRFDVLTVGNAIVDVLAHCDDAFLTDNDIIKGAMNLIDAERSAALFAAMGDARIISGGSAANTAVGVASMGGRAAYFGKVCDDDNGALYRRDMQAQDVNFETEPLTSAPPTATSMIFVTPDSERSMNTYLGACVELGPEDIDADLVAASAVTYFEGYLWDPPRAKDAIRLACDIAHKAGRKTAITLSDTFCIDRYREEFKELLSSGAVDIVFANEAEAKALWETDDFDKALDLLAEASELAVVTRSENGSIAISGADRIVSAAIAPSKLEDTTGAGDLFAAGFLFGLTQGLPLEKCGQLGNFAASDVISVLGARPLEPLADKAKAAGLL